MLYQPLIEIQNDKLKKEMYMNQLWLTVMKVHQHPTSPHLYCVLSLQTQETGFEA